MIHFVITSGIVAIGLIMLGLVVAVHIVARAFSSGSPRSHDAEEARMIQDIYQGLEKMEKRVEALETLLVERETEECHERTQ